MHYQIKDANGNWVDGMPTVNCQLYRMRTESGTWVVSYWAVAEEEV